MGGWVKRIGVSLVAMFIASQLIPVDRHNPPVRQADTIYAAHTVPDRVKHVFDRSCNNCHSNQTAWPWYSHVAPVSWIVAHDVHKGRKTMNFSEWASYPMDKKERRLEEICEQITNGDMPDHKYAIFHRNARPTEEERLAVCDWTDSARQY